MNGPDRLVAIVRAFATHRRAKLAVFVIVLFALGCADLTSADACLELRAEHIDVRARAPNSYVGSRAANIGAVRAGADALAHIHFLGRAGVGAGGTEQRT